MAISTKVKKLKSNSGNIAKRSDKQKQKKTVHNWWMLLSVSVGLVGLIYNSYKGNRITNYETNIQKLQQRNAIVTTWLSVEEENAISWIIYHKEIGFDRIYIFWDDPVLDKDIISNIINSEIIPYGQQIYNSTNHEIDQSESAILHVLVDNDYKEKFWNFGCKSYPIEIEGEIVQAKFKKLSREEEKLFINHLHNGETSQEFQDLFHRAVTLPEDYHIPAYGIHTDTEHTSRQSLYATRAADIASHDGISWLVYIDYDELFYINKSAIQNKNSEPSNLSSMARQFFHQLSSMNVTHANFINHEILGKNFTNDDFLMFFSGNKRVEKISKKYIIDNSIFTNNILIKNSTQARLSKGMQDALNEWKLKRGSDYFSGYICGKGAINLTEWVKRNGRTKKVIANHSVGFNFDPIHAVLQSFISQDKLKNEKDWPHVRTNSVLLAQHFYNPIIIHYVNANPREIYKKFLNIKNSFRNRKRFDLDIVTKEMKLKYELFREYWAPEEGMPNKKLYNNLYDAAIIDLSEANNKNLQDHLENKRWTSQVNDIYSKSAILLSNEQKSKLVKSGLLYENSSVKKFIENTLLSNFSKANGETINYEYHRCLPHLPHYLCDTSDCCSHLKAPILTFDKRLLGYESRGPLGYIYVAR